MINLSKSALLPIVFSLFFVGCETSTKRDCPAFFHPDYEMWAQQQVGETLVFADQNGVTETFDVTEIERSVAFQGLGFGSQESNVSCNLGVREMLVREDSNETILKFFDHREFSDRELADEIFLLRVDVSTGAAETRLYDFSIELTAGFGSVVESGFAVDTRFPELEIGGVLYQDVFTGEILAPSFLVNPDQVRTFTIASGFGLVQYERVNGSVFSLVP